MSGSGGCDSLLSPTLTSGSVTGARESPELCPVYTARPLVTVQLYIAVQYIHQPLLHSSVQWPASVSVCNIRPQPPNLLEINHQELLPICYAPNTENASRQFQVTLTFIQSHHSQFGDHTFTPDIRQARGFDFDINFMIS